MPLDVCAADMDLADANFPSFPLLLIQHGLFGN